MSSQLRRFIALNVIAMSGLLFATGCGQKADLRVHFQPGDKRTVHWVQSMSMSGSAAGANMESGKTTEITCKFDIQEVAAGQASVKATFDQADENMYISMGKTTLPGLDEITGNIGKAYQAMQGESFTFKLAENGKVTNVQGMAALAKKASEKAAGEGDAAKSQQKKTLQTMLSSELSDTMMEKTLSDALGIYPPKPVRINESWTQDEDFSQKQGPIDVTIKASQKFTLKSIQGTTATIEVTSTMSGGNGQAQAIAGTPLKFKFDIKGDGTGNVDVDLKSGWIKRSNLTYKVNGNMQMEGIPGMPAGGEGSGVPLNFEIRSNVDTAEAT